MPIEKSCGAVVFTRKDGEIRYVIVQVAEGFYSFPKGHMEPGETETETALREIWEETGLRPSLLPDFRAEDSHPLMREGRPDVIKEIVYFLAEYHDQTPKARAMEIRQVLLLSYEEAMKAFQYPSSKRILTEANDFLAAGKG